MLGSVWSVAFVVGIAAGGAIVAKCGLVAAFVGDAISFFVGALVFATLPRTRVPPLAEVSSESLEATKTSSVALFRGPLGFAHGAAFVLVATSFSNVGKAAMGLSLVHGARALGNACGAELGVRARATIVFTPLGLAGVALAIHAGPESALGAVGALLWGAGMGALYTSVTHTLQTRTPSRHLGRALARDAMVFTLAWAAGACFAGLSPFARSTTMTAMVVVVLLGFALTIALDRRVGSSEGEP